jgi:hypothetical protein
MKVFLIILSFLSVFSTSYSQKTVKIEFYKESTGDFDIMIQNVLIQNGYDAFVDYGNNTNKADFILTYETTSRANYDELYKFKLTLFDSNRNVINVIKKTISYVNFGVNEPKQICKGVGKLFDYRFNCQSCKEESEVKYFNISFNVHKIDSCIYSITAKGAAIRPLKEVEGAFLKKAHQYLSSFDYYYETDKYKYSAPGPTVTYHNGFVVYGIIKPAASNKQISSKKLDEKPTEFIIEFEKK